MAKVKEKMPERLPVRLTEEQADRMAEEIERENREFEEAPTHTLSVEVDSKLWDAVWEKAKKEDRWSDDVVIEALERYLKP
jgi:hypothetical protein